MKRKLTAIICMILMLSMILSITACNSKNKKDDEEKTYTVTVVDENGEAIEGITVEIHDKKGEVDSDETDEDGKVKFKLEESKNYKAVVNVNGEEYSYEFGSKTKLTIEIVDGVPGLSTENVTQSPSEAPTERPSENNGDTYTRIDADGDENSNGEYILFGNYPQTEVTDSSLTSTLTSLAGTLPTSSNSQSWTSYGYYISSSNSTNFMWYQDIEYNDEKYRGVYFTSYRPHWTDYSSSTSNTFQDDNGYNTSNVYWFKFEPIKWRILEEENGKAMLLCEMIIDSQAYQNTYVYQNGYYYATDSNGNILTDENGNKIYANNYANSTIRAWLNDNFYNTAFSALEKEIIQLTTVDNSVASTLYSSNPYACQDTNDYIFLASAKEVTDTSYGFSSSTSDYDTDRSKQTTDYAQCQGAYTESASSSYAGNGYWWLRSPYSDYSDLARGVNIYGNVLGYNYVNYTYNGVVPALWILL